MGRLSDWLEDNFAGQPERPDEQKLNAIMELPHSKFKEFELWDVERAIFILCSWLYYISYQLGTLEGRAGAMEQSLNADIAFAAQKLKDGYFPERCQVAKANNPELQARSSKLYELKAKAGTLKEMKFSIKDKVDVLKMIYYRRRNESSRD